MTDADGTVVLLVAHGTARTLDEIPDFLRSVRHGRATPPAVVAEVRRRYAAIGGSPLTEITYAQAAGLQARLGRPVRVGMRRWHPFLRDVVRELEAPRRVVVCNLAPQYSELTAGEALRTVREACAERCPDGRTQVVAVPRWADSPRLAEAFAAKVDEGLLRFDPAERDGVVLLFTAHSLPQRVADAGDPYPDECARTLRAVLARVGGEGRPHRWAYQSQGLTSEPWLGPDLPATLAGIAATGARNVLAVPVGFVSDHVEVLYDLDLEARGRAHALGLRLERTASLNADPCFLAALEAVVRAALAPG